MHQFNLIFLHFTDLIRQIGYWPWCFIYHILNIQYLYIVQWNTLLPHPVLCLAVKISNIQNTIYTTQENVHDGEMCAKNEEDNIKYNLKYSFFVNITIKFTVSCYHLHSANHRRPQFLLGEKSLDWCSTDLCLPVCSLNGSMHNNPPLDHGWMQVWGCYILLYYKV